MKVFHIESGLGNQMLSYCEYLAAKFTNPDDECYIETIIYDIPECNDVICQWNGYELERIFGIHAPNIRELFDDNQWEKVVSEIRQSRFWEKNWNYPVYFTQAFEHAGLPLKNIRGDFEEPAFAAKFSGEKTLRGSFVDSKVGDTVKRWYYYLTQKKRIAYGDNTDKIFISSSENLFTGQWLSFKYKSNRIEKIDSIIRDTFQFPEFDSVENVQTAEVLKSNSSVAIHARRGDMLGYNGNCYKYGYFRRAVKYIKKHVSNPLFVFFCDPGSIEWCKENEDIFALDFSKDRVMFVDWNKSSESYRDMQLMSMCKHAVITNSSFGWWGAYLIENPDKITISPKITINTTQHF